ncbi:hypothetical protein T492DRAFT_1132452 [Pavlovales sp. CCMP2436]|nr:hypothetical protein T492DRAFT_1132452 [Pavlovales sp. CCMP2436]
MSGAMSLGSLSFCLLAALLLLDASAFQARRPATLLAAYPLQSGSGRAHAAVLGLVGRAEQETHLVWYSGCADLRVHDHAGLLAAAASGARTIPVFVLDDAVHCHLPEPVLRRLHSALVGLDCDLERNYGGHIVFKEGCAERALVELARETKATVVHLAADEPTFLLAAKLRKATTALEKAGVEVRKIQITREWME